MKKILLITLILIFVVGCKHMRTQKPDGKNNSQVVAKFFEDGVSDPSEKSDKSPFGITSGIECNIRHDEKAFCTVTGCTYQANVRAAKFKKMDFNPIFLGQISKASTISLGDSVVIGLYVADHKNLKYSKEEMVKFQKSMNGFNAKLNGKEPTQKGKHVYEAKDIIVSYDPASNEARELVYFAGKDTTGSVPYKIPTPFKGIGIKVDSHISVKAGKDLAIKWQKGDGKLPIYGTFEWNEKGAFKVVRLGLKDDGEAVIPKSIIDKIGNVTGDFHLTRIYNQTYEKCNIKSSSSIKGIFTKKAAK